MCTYPVSLNYSHLFSGSQAEEVATAIGCGNTDRFIEKDSSEESWIIHQKFGLRKAYVISAHHFIASTNQIALSHYKKANNCIPTICWRFEEAEIFSYGTNKLLQLVLWSPNIWASLPPVCKKQSHFFSKEKAQKSNSVSIWPQTPGFLYDL